ncbi:class I adenylate-forming enzyme family protein [Pararhodobacter oceanensis]|uniref:Benzoate--CoA ligase n=1 Tax=Pararhodobacter oceanensis TaxID=2172121 RepID=A0A2T8HTS0_9RHOB|nr:class I adenylate-forming enzyme family protein [Pararhodobacter oceanensis]PVH28786.1 benzoate--CoA ligase [Pararhodobacter oceanensis]
MHALIDIGPFAPCPSPFNLAEYVLRAGQALPDKIALQILSVTGAERWSYAALIRAIRGTGTGLLQAGLTPGDRLLLRLDNTVDFPLAFLGAIAVGVVPVPTSSQLTQAEITAMAQQIAPQAVIAAPDISRPDIAAKVIDLATLRSWRELPPCDFEMGDPERLAYLVFTSGTSGAPRAVMHAHRAIWARRMMWRDWYGLTEGDRLLHAGAFNWTYTLGTGLLDPWTLGATALIPAAGIKPAQLPLLLKRFDATIFAAAPGVYRQLLKSPIPALPRLRHGLSAGEKLPEETREKWSEATGRRVFESLGMSEISTYVSASPERAAPLGASGFAQTGRRIAVLDAAHQPVVRGTPGIMAIDARDPGLFLGYWNDAAQTEARFADGWFLTGDTVSMDDAGAITYLGRDDDMMNAGGYRVSPLEVERVFEALPQISECAAVELSVREGVKVIALFYVADGPCNEAELADHAETVLARYKQPRLYIARADIPRSANNKLNRAALRAGWKGSQ